MDARPGSLDELVRNQQRPAPATPPKLDLDAAQIDQILGHKGRNNNGIYQVNVARAEKISESGTEIPSSMGLATALNFQPVGNRRAAINGDIAMIAAEVQNVITALRAAGIQIVEIHNHTLDDQPRVFFLHFWKIDDGVALARGLAAAVHATNVHPA